tara:strand:- start:1187 stop:2140 length:954 start_codon:yes stop_codon:yes gene_type:complete
MLSNVAIIGAGNIGFRHFQGIIKYNSKLKIFLVDPLIKNLKNKYLDELNIDIDKKLIFYEDISLLPKNIDFLVCSTSSDVRFEILNELIDKKEIANILLEKIVFQKKNDFIKIGKKFKNLKIKSWVNCPQRYFDFYRNLKLSLDGEKIEMISNGCDWSLASNSVHVIDLFCFLTGDYNINFSENNLDEKKIFSKRKGFYELKGSLVIKNKYGRLILEDSENYDYIQKFFIKTGNSYYEIDEIKGDIIMNGEKRMFSRNEFPFQSDLTFQYLNELSITNNISLVSFEDCYKYHMPMLDSFNTTFSKIFKKNIITSPIT